MGILPILTIFYALFAMGMATDAVAETPASPSAPELSQELDATLTGALAISEDAAEADSPEENQEEDVAALDGGDEAAEDDSPVAPGFDVEVTEDVAENDNPAPADQEVMEDAAEDDTTADSKAPIVKRVVGGSVAGMNSWPWQVSLQYRSGSRYYHTCGGILIKRNWVLTAAHCVDARRSYRVVAGEHDLNRLNCREQFLNVRNIYKHPSWRRNVAAGNDIALLRLSTYATLNSYVKLAVLPPANQVLNSGTCYITGWGRTSTRGSTSNVLRYAYLPIVSYSTCRNRYWWGSTVKSTMVCAGGNGRQAGCFGDSGGPLNCYRNRRWEVHGITSFVSGRGCNTVRKPTVFTRVSAFTCWINNVAR